jgi:hypothetical protein
MPEGRRISFVLRLPPRRRPFHRQFATRVVGRRVQDRRGQILEGREVQDRCRQILEGGQVLVDAMIRQTLNGW